MGGRICTGSPVDKCSLRGGQTVEYFVLKTSKNAPMNDIYTGLEILRLTALHSRHHNLSRNQV
jgi:hypothetical protein